jgi:predicted nuclease with TOPRIM domain
MIVDNIKELLEGQAKELITSLETQIEEQAIENQKLEAEQEEVNSKLYWLNLENEQLKKEIGSINTISKLMKVSDNNLDDALNLFGFIPFHNYNDGMNKVPAWFKCLIKYYDQKEKLLKFTIY